MPSEGGGGGREREGGWEGKGGREGGGGGGGGEEGGQGGGRERLQIVVEGILGASIASFPGLLHVRTCTSPVLDRLQCVCKITVSSQKLVVAWPGNEVRHAAIAHQLYAVLSILG